MKYLIKVSLLAVLLGALIIQVLPGDTKEKSATERLWEQKKIVQEELDKLESLTTTIFTSIKGIFAVDRTPWKRLENNIKVMKEALNAIDGHLKEIEADYPVDAPALKFDLTGQWHDGFSPCRIEHSEELLKVWIDTSPEPRGPFNGKFTGQDTIQVDFVDDKGCCTGTIIDHDTIKWSNGVTWKRK